jgi:hypothetical protein
MAEADLAGKAHQHVETEHRDKEDAGDHQRIEESAWRHDPGQHDEKDNAQDREDDTIAPLKPDDTAMDALLVAHVGAPRRRRGE